MRLLHTLAPPLHTYGRNLNILTPKSVIKYPMIKIYFYFYIILLYVMQENQGKFWNKVS